MIPTSSQTRGKLLTFEMITKISEYRTQTQLEPSYHVNRVTVRLIHHSSRRDALHCNLTYAILRVGTFGHQYTPRWRLCFASMKQVNCSHENSGAGSCCWGRRYHHGCSAVLLGMVRANDSAHGHITAMQNIARGPRKNCQNMVLLKRRIGVQPGRGMNERPCITSIRCRNIQRGRDCMYV